MDNVISANAQYKVYEAVKLRFKDSSMFKFPASFILYEQGLLSLEDIHELSKKEYLDNTLELTRRLYVSHEYRTLCENTYYIPAYIDNMNKEFHVMTIPEFKSNELPTIDNGFKIVVHLTDLVWYILNHINVYGYPDFLLPLPTHDILDFIIEEAISLQVMDTTISSGPENTASVYHNVNLRTVHSKRKVTNHDVQDILRLLCFRASDALDPSNRNSKRLAVQLTKDYRARVEITPTHHGYMITMRLLPNSFFSDTLDDINVDDKTKLFLRRYCQSMKIPGARIVAGPTGSGKNTTIFAIISEIQKKQPLKIISLEQPVERLLKGMEQVEALTDDLFSEYSNSLIRHNPDLVYFSEITDRTALDFMKVANTGKTVFSTVHTNNAATIVSRLIDLTKLSIDRIIQDMHSLMHQRLIKDRHFGMKPVTTCIYFSDALKKRCIGKNLGEVINILNEQEDRWRVFSSYDIDQGILER